MEQNNKFIVTATVLFDTGTLRRVDWIEENLTKNIEGSKTPVTDVDDALFEFRKLFLQYMTHKKVFTTENIKNRAVIIPMDRVLYVEVSVKRYEEATEIKEENKGDK